MFIVFVFPNCSPPVEENYYVPLHVRNMREISSLEPAPRSGNRNPGPKVKVVMLGSKKKLVFNE